MPLDVLGVFFVTSVLLALAPGPDNVFVLTESALRGRTSGLLITLGLCTGLIAHTSAVALGVAALLKTSALAYTILKLAGAAYLLYLAWMSFRHVPEKLPATGQTQIAGWRLYRRGILMNVTNPKVTIFFLAFLPAFADPARGAMTAQIAILGAVFIVATLLVFGTIALIASRLGQWLAHSPRTQRAVSCTAGAIFAVMALRLLTTEL